MPQEIPLPRSFVPLYWKIWLGLLASLLALRVTVFHRLEEGKLVWVFVGYAVPTWFAVMIVNAVEGNRVSHRLKEFHRARWEELTNGSLANPFRGLAFLYSKDDLGDPALAALKRNYQRLVILLLTIFFSMLPVFLAVVLPWDRILRP